MARRLILLAAASMVLNTVCASARDFTAPRERMVATIQELAKTITLSVGSEGIHSSVLAAMRQVPRHELVPEDVRDAAYENRPLPIGYGQTISQPYIVALRGS